MQCAQNTLIMKAIFKCYWRI